MFFHNSSKIEYRWISLNAFEISSAVSGSTVTLDLTNSTFSNLNSPGDFVNLTSVGMLDDNYICCYTSTLILSIPFNSGASYSEKVIMS